MRPQQPSGPRGIARFGWVVTWHSHGCRQLWLGHVRVGVLTALAAPVVGGVGLVGGDTTRPNRKILKVPVGSCRTLTPKTRNSGTQSRNNRSAS